MPQVTKILSLCAPDQEKSCFACCPPIRPAGYEHIQYQKTVERFLRENRACFDPSSKEIKPITGYHCWALGYIDDEYKRVGCLLHPAQNKGNDLRFRIDYGDKCRRETCEEEKVFASLETSESFFWLQLADGLDSFTYSSRTLNPLFRMLGWGRHLLQNIAAEEAQKAYSWRAFLQSYPFFSTGYKPRSNAYLVNELIHKNGLHILKTGSFCSKFEAISETVSRKIQHQAQGQADDPFVHQLDLDPYFLDFLRLSGKITKLDRDSAVSLKKIVDDELEQI
ncbi:MAG: hypothetical protein JW932_01825 [Deltaproteobacteria bacterium]|nr:hypothetical protein [Deltaproteobacteria bacterium]